MNIWDDIQLLDRLAYLRAAKARTGRLTFDCLNLRYRNGRAYCSRGKLLGQAEDGSLTLMAVLRGITSDTCKNCGDFTTEEEL